MGRQVELKDVGDYPWSSRAIAWGYDTRTGEHVAFAVSKNRGAALRDRLDYETIAIVDVNPLDVLFARSAAGSPRSS
jgi:hypothetical protein